MAVNVRCPLRAVLLLTVGTTILTHSALATPSATANIHINRQPMAQALESLSQQTGQSVIFSPELVDHLEAPSVNGPLSADAAVERLLNGSGLVAEVAPGGGMVIRRGAATKRLPKHLRASRTRDERDIEQIVATGHRTRSVLSISGDQMQEMMPGQNPMQALDLLPGVTFTNVDPWGNNEQNSSIYVHGFSNSQLG